MPVCGIQTPTLVSWAEKRWWRSRRGKRMRRRRATRERSMRFGIGSDIVKV